MEIKKLKRGIAIDMDGVLIDSMKFYIITWKETFNKKFLNIDIGAGEIYFSEGVKGIEFIHRVSKKRGMTLNSGKIIKMHNYKKNLFWQNFKIESFKGIGADVILPNLDSVTSLLLNGYNLSKGEGEWNIP